MDGDWTPGGPEDSERDELVELLSQAQHERDTLMAAGRGAFPIVEPRPGWEPREDIDGPTVEQTAEAIRAMVERERDAADETGALCDAWERDARSLRGILERVSVAIGRAGCDLQDIPDHVHEVISDLRAAPAASAGEAGPRRLGDAGAFIAAARDEVAALRARVASLAAALAAVEGERDRLRTWRDEVEAGLCSGESGDRRDHVEAEEVVAALALGEEITDALTARCDRLAAVVRAERAVESLRLTDDGETCDRVRSEALVARAALQPGDAGEGEPVHRRRGVGRHPLDGRRDLPGGGGRQVPRLRRAGRSV